MPELDLQGLIRQHSEHSLLTFWDRLLPHERLKTVGLAIRDRLVDIAVQTNERYRQSGAKMVYYLSMEFLIGRSLANNLVNLGLYDQTSTVLKELHDELAHLEEWEHDASLGNGGLGRLAACFLDSLATLDLPAWGFGILYEYGLFKQEIRDGHQVEKPDGWLTFGTPWLVERPERAIPVRLYGHVVNAASDGTLRPTWVGGTMVLGIPHDMPIVGYGGRTVNLLRLFSARAPQEINMESFNEGHFLEALSEQTRVETIHKVLYPNDHVARGPELRLVQEYFLVACAVHTILDFFSRFDHGDVRHLASQTAIQLNDTHPALTVAELMRILVDDHRLPWEEAWAVTTSICAYTNHTLMPEALEKWPVALFERVLPRHLQIIYEINRRHLDEVARSFPDDVGKLGRMSLIEEGPEKHVRMALLAIVGSHSVNGVAEVHSELVKTHLVPDFYALTPKKFNNKTNGVTPRRWLRLCHPGLAKLISGAIGERWIVDLERLRDLEPFAADAGFRAQFQAVKAQNKAHLARVLGPDSAAFDPHALLDVHVKRIHLYKRQLLNVLRVVHDYLLLTEDNHPPTVPRTYLFAGKAAPGYIAAKDVIYLINHLAAFINHDPKTRGHMRMVFARDYRVTLAERIIPAADLSEQISTAGTEASGTSNMKFAMNGALTIGTLDGANIEIRAEVGPENIFIFGKTVAEIDALNAGQHHPREFYGRSPVIRRILDAFTGDRLSPGTPGKFAWVFWMLVDQWDPYFHLADLDAYLAAQEKAAQLYRDPAAWSRQAILNVARIGKFSSDRSIHEYARDIWKIAPVKA
jgi:starch phosphorylase